MAEFKEDEKAFFRQMKSDRDREWADMFDRFEQKGYDIVTLSAKDELPRLVIYPAREGAARGSFIICAGGAFVFKSYNEAESIANYFYEKGFHTAILDYRLQPNPITDSAADGHAAIRYLRQNAAKYHVDPDHIAIGGFSAGGMLSNLAGTTWPDQESRPDAVILGYGAFSEVTSVGKLGFDFKKQNQLARLSGDMHLNADCPPYFLFQTTADDPRNIAYMQIRLTELGIPFEAHTFAGGAHGNGLYDGKDFVEDNPHTAHWAELCAEWLDGQGFHCQ